MEYSERPIPTKQMDERLKSLFSDLEDSISPTYKQHSTLYFENNSEAHNDVPAKGKLLMFPENLESKTAEKNISEIQEISRYVLLLWRWAWLIVLLGCIAAVLAYFGNQLFMPVYQTSTSLLVLNASDNNAQDYGSVQASQSLTGTYADILTQESILREVISRLNLPTSPEILAKSIKVSPNRSTQMIIITVEGNDEALITDTANTLVTIFIDRIKQTQSARYSSSKENLSKEMENIDAQIQNTNSEKAATQDPIEKDKLDAKLVQYRQMYANLLTNYEQTRLAEIQSTSDIVLISPAGLSYKLASPSDLLIGILAGVIIMVLAAGVVIIRDALDDTLKTPEEITQKLNLPVLAVICKGKTDGPPITQIKPDSLAAEAFRILSTKIQHFDMKRPMRSIMVSSPTKAEGKSTISVNLAIVLAQAGNCVTLIDSNFSSPVIHNWLGLANNVGLSDLFLLGPAGLTKEGILQKIPNESLFVISSGVNSFEKRNKVVPKNFNGILEELTHENNVVVIDTAPVLRMADTLTLSTMVDGLLLVINAGKTTLAEAKQAIESFHSVNAKIIGVVLNDKENIASH
jgi:polysaccharide biosynthesis transport protein